VDVTDPCALLCTADNSPLTLTGSLRRPLPKIRRFFDFGKEDFRAISARISLCLRRRSNGALQPFAVLAAHGFETNDRFRRIEFHFASAANYNGRCSPDRITFRTSSFKRIDIASSVPLLASSIQKSKNESQC
jgi:hypothetical protein